MKNTPTPEIHDFPFRVEITDLLTNTTERKYCKTKEEVLKEVQSVDTDDFYVSGWDRLTNDVFISTHEEVDAIDKTA